MVERQREDRSSSETVRDKGGKTEPTRRYKGVWMQWTNVCLKYGVESVGERKDEEVKIADNHSPL